MVQVDFTQKKNSTFLVAAAPVEDSHAPRPEDRVQATPYRNADAFLAAARTARCSDQTLAALMDAATRAENHPETSIVCTLNDVEAPQLAAMGLHGIPSTHAAEFASR